MATRLKTVHYAFPTLAALTNNTLTSLTQITIFLPETGTKTFRSVVAHITCDDIITATGGTLTTKTLNFRLGAAAYTSVANANTLTNSGENISFHLTADYTTHFVTNWTGTSMTADFQLQINQSTGTTTGMVNVGVTLEITYEYDDTSTTQVKSVMIPLNAPVSTITTAAVTYDTFPALNTYLPETSKVYRNMYIVVQGNEQRNATTDHTMTIRLGASNVTTGNYEGALASDRWFRYVWNLTAAGFTDTANTQNFQLSTTVARCNHPQCYAVITYEYNETTSTSIMNSVMLPLDINAPFGGTTASDYQRATRDFFIQEPGTITTNKVAFFPFWSQIAAIAGLNMRIGTGAFVTYTDGGAQYCGTNGGMVRNDSAFTLARGRNSLNFDVYRTDAGDFGWNTSGFWLINYTSSKHSTGSGAHNHTVFWGLQQNGTAAAADNYNIAATSIIIPETSYYMTAIGARLITLLSGTVVPAGFSIGVEKLAVEGGVEWEQVYVDITQTDAEIGTFYAWAQSKTIFDRWPGDPDPERIDAETNRRWRINLPQPAATAASGWVGVSQLFTYHTITYTVSGTVSGSSGGTVTLNVHRATSGEKVLSTTRTGNGTYSLTWYDNTESLFVEARESGTLLGRSDTGVAV